MQVSELHPEPQALPPRGLLDSVYSTLEVTELVTGAQSSPDIIGSLITHCSWFNLWPDTYFLTQINNKQVPQDRYEVRSSPEPFKGAFRIS